MFFSHLKVPLWGRKVVMIRKNFSADAELEALVELAGEILEAGDLPFANCSTRIELAEQVVTRLASGNCPLTVLRLCTYGEGRNDESKRLLRAVFTAMSPKSRNQFEKELSQLESSDWRILGFDASDIIEIFLGNDPQSLSPSCIRNWRRRVSELVIDMDRYWQNRIAADISCKNWNRAWDNLRHALIGLQREEDCEGEESFTLMQIRRWHGYRGTEDVLFGRMLYCQNSNTRNTLVRQVFDAMVRNKVLEPLTIEDRLLNDSTESITVTRNSRRERAPVTFKISVERPGLLEATPFMKLPKKDEDAWPIPLSDEGCMILKIAAFARNKRNENRKNRNAKRKKANNPPKV
jgi:hypothetical protein